MPSAMMPFERTLENADRSVRFTTPRRVTKSTNWFSGKSRVTSTWASFSPSANCTRLTIGLPRDGAAGAAGISCTLSQYSRPRLVMRHQVRVGRGDEEVRDEVVFLGGGARLAAPAALLRAVLGERAALDVAGVADSVTTIGSSAIRSSVEISPTSPVISVRRVVGVLLAHVLQLGADHRQQRATRSGECPPAWRSPGAASTSSLNSSSRCRPVSFCSRMSRMFCACSSEKPPPAYRG